MLISGQLVGWAFLGFVPLAILFTRQVWQSYFDITRAAAPVLTAFVLLVFVSGRVANEQVFAPDLDYTVVTKTTRAECCPPTRSSSGAPVRTT